MKKILYVLVCMLVICACNRKGVPYEGASDQYQESAQVDSNAYNSINENRHDTLKVQVDTLALSVSRIQEKMSNDSTLIAEKLDNKMEGYSIFAIIAAFAILLIAIIVLFVKNKELRSRLNNAESKEDNHFRLLNQQVQNLQGQDFRQNGISLSKQDIDNLNQALQSYNTRLNALEAKDRQKKAHTVQDKPETQPTVERYIYFGVNNGDKFIKELVPSDESAAFKAKKISENEVEFEPLSWNKIRSLNSLEAVVIIKSINGSNIKVLSNGLAVKRSYNGHDFWLVTKPAEIKLV